MATTSIWKVTQRIDKVVNYATDEEKTKNEYADVNMNQFYSVRDLLMYATNPDKTEKQFYTTAINCKLETAVDEMQFIKKIKGKEGGILAFHGYQSFKAGEVTPEIAHEIGVRLAEEMWGDRFQVVVSTHLNTENIHNHFVLNSVSFKDGLKYYSNLANTALLRRTSDELCEEYDLSVLPEKTCRSGINFENFYKKSMKESDYYKFAKEDLDYAIEHAYALSDMGRILEHMGYSYYYRADKLTIRDKYHKRNIRAERAFGEEYSLYRIKQRILSHDLVNYEDIIPYRIPPAKKYTNKRSFKKVYKPKGIIALYYYYKHLLGLYPKYNQSFRLTPEMRADIRKMDMYSEQIRFMCKYKLETLNRINDVKNEKKEELQKYLNCRNRLYYKRKNLKEDDDKDLITKQKIAVTSELEKIRKELKMCDVIYDNSIKMRENIREMEEKEHPKENEKEKTKKRKYVR